MENVKKPTLKPKIRIPKVVVDENINDYTTIIVACIAILLTIVIIAIYRRKKLSRRGILLTGLCDSGKTLIYSRLVHQRFANTQTSIKENIGDYSLNGKNLRVIDIPGHERLRNKFFDSYKNITCGIVYVIDSQTIQKDIRDVAEFLYNILCDPIILSNQPGILILCNKQDQPLVKGCGAIQNILEKEMTTLRITKSSQLESVDPKVKAASLLGHENEPFSFASLSQYNVDFIETYATNNDQDSNIVDLEKWLAKVT